MYPRLFLSAGGSVLLLLAVVGYVDVFTEAGSPTFWLDPVENALHAGLALAALGALFMPGLKTILAPHQRAIVAGIAVITLFLGVYGFALPVGSGSHPNLFGVANLESPVDNLLHLVLGVVAAAAVIVPQGGEPAA